MALPSPIDAAIPCETVSTALQARLGLEDSPHQPLWQRLCLQQPLLSAGEAETELRQHLGLLDSDTPARHLKMRIGRVTEHWNKNCLAVGLSQGFIEPLEATALLFIQHTATAFAEVPGAGRPVGAGARELQPGGQ